MQKQEIKIKTNFPVFDGDSPAFALFLKSLDLQITELFANEINQSESKEEFIKNFTSALPFLTYKYHDKEPYVISVMAICHSQYTHGVGRFISDICSRWLAPGRQLPIIYVNSLVFQFDHELSPSYFFHELLLKAETEENFKHVKSNLERLMREIKLNIMAVEHARTIVSLKPLTIDQKKMIVKENIASLLDRPSKEFDLNTFDQMHHAILKVMGEEKVEQVRGQIAALHDTRPQVFERDVFNELQHFILLFKDTFLASRESKHITRVAAYMYLFRKNTNNNVTFDPYKRHLSLKILKTELNESNKNKPILGIIIGINLLRENEIFEEKHIIEAIRSCLPQVKVFRESSIIDRRGSDKVRILYLEVRKKDYESFNVKEIKTLRKKLPFELKSSIESMINPVFMPRNEEEVMRNILTLSKQLRYVQDIPQVIISFQKQTQTTVSFTIVLLRLLKPGTVPLKTLFSLHGDPSIYFDNLDSKIVGQLRKKYSKEANVFEIHIKKNEFLRKDYSLDLYEARKKVYSILTYILGEIRDYNGGMISKQSEVFKQLTQIVKQENINNDFLLKNFFYSITPIYMQSLLQPQLLAHMFMMLNKALYHHDYNTSPYFLETQIEDNYLILLFGTINTKCREFITKKVEDSSFVDHLISSYITTYDISCAGYLLKFESTQEHVEFYQMIREQINDWNNQFSKLHDQDIISKSFDSMRSF